MRAILVLGKQPKRDGSNAEFHARLDRGRELFLEGRGEVIIISGGKTRPSLPAEAIVGRDYLLEKGIQAKYLWIEDSSYSTSENIRFVKAMIQKMTNEPVDRLVIVTGNYMVPRTWILIRALWAEVRHRVEYVRLRQATPRTIFTESILTPIALVDPRERGPISFAKIWLRNKLRKGKMNAFV